MCDLWCLYQLNLIRHFEATEKLVVWTDGVQFCSKRKYAYLSRPYHKDKLVARKLQSSRIFNFINLTINRLLIDRQLHCFRNNTKCALHYDPFLSNTPTGQLKIIFYVSPYPFVSYLTHMFFSPSQLGYLLNANSNREEIRKPLK